MDLIIISLIINSIAAIGGIITYIEWKSKLILEFKSYCGGTCCFAIKNLGGANASKTKLTLLTDKEIKFNEQGLYNAIITKGHNYYIHFARKIDENTELKYIIEWNTIIGIKKHSTGYVQI